MAKGNRRFVEDDAETLKWDSEPITEEERKRAEALWKELGET